MIQASLSYKVAKHIPRMYGIDPYTGAIVVVRPDGYISTVAPLENVSNVDAYFSAFLTPPV